ncbi:hypothetical protein DPX16_22965 [Anabarilius grahami]|uniref:Uncharacterized protein n=1 Tax=Anabarilius grahami TaxID=495550 RepID=A0A3N0Y5Y9_ANAGA|nr:hypothetical protein DPX16_22965 [Anabarilius grahami]
MDAEEVEALNAMSEGESDGGEISGASKVGSAYDGSSDSDPEPPRNIRLTVLQDRIATIVTESKAVSPSKVLYESPPNQPATQPTIKVDNTTLENVDHFLYLGSLLSTKADIHSEINHRLSCANEAYARSNLSAQTKLLVYRAVVLPKRQLRKEKDKKAQPPLKVTTLPCPHCMLIADWPLQPSEDPQVEPKESDC